MHHSQSKPRAGACGERRVEAARAALVARQGEHLDLRELRAQHLARAVCARVLDDQHVVGLAGLAEDGLAGTRAAARGGCT
jgi:hypothetical protein